MALTLLVFFAGDALSSLPALIGLEVAGAAGSAEALELAGEPNLGSPSGLVALLGASIASLPAVRGRDWALVALAVGLVVGIAVERDVAAVQHLIALAAGAGSRSRSGSADRTDLVRGREPHSHRILIR